MISYVDVLKVVSKLMNGSPFWTSSHFFFTNTRKAYGGVTPDLCTNTAHALILWLLIVLCAWQYHRKIQYHQQGSIMLTCMYSGFWLFIRKGLPFHYFNINFDATVTTSSQGITICKYLQINSLHFPICEKCDFKILSNIFWTTLYIMLHVNNYFIYITNWVIEQRVSDSANFKYFLHKI